MFDRDPRRFEAAALPIAFTRDAKEVQFGGGEFHDRTVSRVFDVKREVPSTSAGGGLGIEQGMYVDSEAVPRGTLGE